MDVTTKLEELSNFIITGKHFDAQYLTNVLLELEVDPKIILDESLMKGMSTVGKRFRDQLMFVPQVLVAARAMKFSMSSLEPYLIKNKVVSKGKVLIGTVKGDVHDIGKNLVSIMLQGSGYQVVDIGTGCSAEKYFEEYIKHKPDVIGMSALLTTTMLYMKTVVEYFREKNINVPIIIGGAPLNQRFADDIGANGFGKNSYDAVKLVDKILKVNHG